MILDERPLRQTSAGPLAVLTGASEMNCRSCLAPSDFGDRFCRNCGLALERPCPRCGQIIRQFGERCRKCGHDPNDEPRDSLAFPRPDPAKPEAGFIFTGERKFLTVMFADIVGSTALVEDLDPEQSGATLQPLIDHGQGGPDLWRNLRILPTGRRFNSKVETNVQSNSDLATAAVLSEFNRAHRDAASAPGLAQGWPRAGRHQQRGNRSRACSYLALSSSRLADCGASCQCAVDAEQA